MTAAFAAIYPDDLPAVLVADHKWHARVRVRDYHIIALRKLAALPPPAYTGNGDGIVTVGEGDYWPGIVITVKLLREIGCRLPVEVWHRSTAGAVNATDIAGLDVTLRDAAVEAALRGDARILEGWQAKTYALAHTRFARTFLLDADAYCVEDPTPLFDRLAARPFLFWQDLPGRERNVRWRWAWPKGPGGVPPIQGGHVLIDRRAAARELYLAHWINQRADYYYPEPRSARAWHLYGDQDAWRVALAVTDGPYQSLGGVRQHGPALVCRHDNRPLVVHRVNAKLLPDAPFPFVRGLPREDRVQELFAEIVRR